MTVTEETLLTLHRLTRGDIWYAGKNKENDSDIIEKHADGTSNIRFKTVPVWAGQVYGSQQKSGLAKNRKNPIR